MINIVIADDHQLFREGLKLLLAQQADIQVVGEAADGRQALELVREHKPDVAVLDVSMPRLNGIDAVTHICADTPETAVLLLSGHREHNYVTRALTAGASGYVVKDSSFDDFLRGLRTVAGGGMYLSNALIRPAVQEYVRAVSTGRPSLSHREALSTREREVLQLISEGNSTKQIAATLHLSTKTVDGYRRQIMDKLGIFNIAGLVKHAIREGLTSP